MAKRHQNRQKRKFLSTLLSIGAGLGFFAGAVLSTFFHKNAGVAMAIGASPGSCLGGAIGLFLDAA